MAQRARRAADRATKETIQRTQKLLEESAEELAKKMSTQTKGTLSERHLQELMKSYQEKQKELNRELKNAFQDGIEKGAKAGSSSQSFLGDLIPDGEVSKSFKSMLANVNDGVVKTMIQGDLYSDHRTLSERIWNITNEFGAKVQDVVAKGMLQQKSARELAKDLRSFVKPPEKRPLSWRGSFEDYKTYHANWNAKRLARTTINHSYQTATIQAAKNNPYVTGILWQTAGDHRVCDLCESREGKVFPVDDVPMDHPNGRCTMIPNIEKSLDDISNELSAWIDGEENESLDSWYSDISKKDIDIITTTSYNRNTKVGGSSDNYYNPVSREQVLQMAKDGDIIISRHVNIQSKWSGQVEFMDKAKEDSIGGKFWNCNIGILEENGVIESSIDVLMHEHLHARSISYFDSDTYLNYKKIEEASVQFLNQEICIKENIEYVLSGYDEWIDKLRELNKNLDYSDYDFAQMLFHQPVPDRTEWLANELMNAAMEKQFSIEKMNEISEIIKFFEELV